MKLVEHPSDSDLDSVIRAHVPRRNTEFWTRVQLGGQRFIAVGSIDYEEVDRRSAAAPFDATRFSVASSIWSAPSSIPLTPSEVEALPEGAVEVVEGRCVRVARAPVRVDTLVAESRYPAEGLCRFADKWWAPLRLVVAERSASSATRRRASFLGVGLIERDAMTVEPIVQRPVRLSPVLAWQAELVFAQVTDQWPPTA